MTNQENWNKYTENLTSPENFVQWGFRYAIAAALQRRVWIPSGDIKLYPNIYPVLVAKAGIGKGLVIRYVHNIIAYHKLKVNGAQFVGRTEEERKALADIQQVNQDRAREKYNDGGEEDALLIPIASDAVTYEALVQLMARSYRMIEYDAYSEKLGRNAMQVYGHSSLAFCLEEMGSLFRKNTESTINFLLQAYDCGEQYEYRTKHSGVDRVRRLCLNFLAGATPEFIQEVLDDRLLSQGFSSRAFFIYASENRKTQFFIPAMTKEQEACRDALREHVRKLSRLYGPIEVSPELVERLEAWFKDYRKQSRVGKSPKLDPYEARKNIHVMKCATIHHFMERTDLKLTWEDFQWAIDVLADEEKTMHLALSFSGSNPQAKMAGKISGLLQTGRRNFVDLLAESFNYGTEKDLMEVLDYMVKTGQAAQSIEEDKDTGQRVMYWTAKAP